MKKFILCFLISLIVPQLMSAYDFSTDNFNFNFICSTNDVVLCSQIETTPTVNIPANITFRNKTFNVTKIADGAFRGKNIQSVVIPEGIVEIGDNAFRNTKIQQLVLPNSVNRIGEYAFANCSELKYVEFGTGIISSRYVRSLRHTFAFDDNIEKIVFRGNRPPLSINDYPAFTNMTKQFAQVWVPLNGYYHFLKSEWKTSFSNPINAYVPEGVATEFIPYAFYFWDDTKINATHQIKGVVYTYNGDKPLEIPAELIIDVMEPSNDKKLCRITFKAKMGNEDFRINSQTFYTFMPTTTGKTQHIVGENWNIIDADADPQKKTINVYFYNGKFNVPKKILGSYVKDSYKKVDAQLMKISIEAGGNLSDFQGEFKVTEFPENLIEFEYQAK